MFLWMKLLNKPNVISIDKIIPVITQHERKMGELAKSNQNGGIRCKFDGIPLFFDMMGYWKPCTEDYLPGNTETFFSEIISFHLDRILGFYRTPPVFPFYFHSNILHSLANNSIVDTKAMYKVQTILDKCGNSKGAEGALVAWSNMPIVGLD